MSLKDELISYAQEIDIDEIKITHAEPLLETRKALLKMKKKGYLSKFVNDDLERITTPRKVLPTAKSIIVCAISYAVDVKHINSSKDEGLRGRFSRFAWGNDYHQVLGEKLESLIRFLSNRIGDLEAIKFVDTGPTVDRALARRAGVGWQGKNCSIISPKYGSWIFLGGIITNLKFDYDAPLEERCGDCKKCIEACPTGALKESYTLDSRRCLGYITLSKGYISKDYRKKMGDRVWGCDTCQEVCPYNQEAKRGNHYQFRPQNIEAYPDLINLLNLTNEEYRDRFGSTAMNWRGKRPIKRNAAIALGNMKNREAIPYLIKALDEPSPIIRAHVIWALGELGGEEVVDRLKILQSEEREIRVLQEIEDVIKKITGS